MQAVQYKCTIIINNNIIIITVVVGIIIIIIIIIIYIIIIIIIIVIIIITIIFFSPSVVKMPRVKNKVKNGFWSCPSVTVSGRRVPRKATELKIWMSTDSFWYRMWLLLDRWKWKKGVRRGYQGSVDHPY